MRRSQPSATRAVNTGAQRPINATLRANVFLVVCRLGTHVAVLEIAPAGTARNPVIAALVRAPGHATPAHLALARSKQMVQRLGALACLAQATLGVGTVLFAVATRRTSAANASVVLVTPVLLDVRRRPRLALTLARTTTADPWSAEAWAVVLLWQRRAVSLQQAVRFSLGT